MSKNEIRLRRQRMGARGPDRYRNYGALLERRDKEARAKKIFRVFAYFVVILVLVALIFILSRLERKAGGNGQTAGYEQVGKKERQMIVDNRQMITIIQPTYGREI